MEVIDIFGFFSPLAHALRRH